VLTHHGILKMSTEHQAPSTLTDGEYLALTRAVLSGIEAHIDRWLQEDVIDIDSSRTGGLLELSFPNGSKMVINTQPPLHELWLAARSGGFHFRYAGGRWVDTKSGQEFFAELSARASEQAGLPLVFEPPVSS
jgi:CyaY protein